MGRTLKFNQILSNMRVAHKFQSRALMALRAFKASPHNKLLKTILLSRSPFVPKKPKKFEHRAPREWMLQQ
jgi:hypothetical protein